MSKAWLRSTFKLLAQPSRLTSSCLRSRPFSTIDQHSSSGPSTKFKSPIYSFSSPSAQTTSLIALDSEYLLQVFARPEFVLSHGKGSYVWDTEGRKYLDFSAGIAVNAIGHGDEEFVKALSEQAGKYLHTSNAYHNEWAGRLAQLLVTQTQKEGGLGYASNPLQPQEHPGSQGAKIFFSNSGTEANEGALKIARKVGKDRWAAKSPGRTWDSNECTKTRIACFENSFHGRSMGALSVTSTSKYQKPFEPLLPGIDIGKLNDYNQLERLVREDTCAVIVEPVQGEGGIHTADVNWLRALRERCDAMGAVLIYDEIQCGLYRTGSIWAHSEFPVDCHPDIVTMAKPLANGYPIGAVLLRDSIATSMTAGSHGTTFGGSPLACAMGHHVLSRISNPDSIANLKETSAYLVSRLENLPRWFPKIVQENIRGRGLILGLGFKNSEHPTRVVSLARERGVFVLAAGKDAVRLVPSLTIGKADVDLAVDVLESCLAEF